MPSTDQVITAISGDARFSMPKTTRLVADYESWTGLLVSRACPSCDKFEQLGYLVAIRGSDPLGLKKTHVLTPKGTKLSVEWIAKGSDPELGGRSWDVPLLKRQVRHVLGVRLSQEGRAEVQFDWSYTPAGTTGAEFNRETQFPLSTSNATLTLFDTGWRVVSISDLDH